MGFSRIAVMFLGLTLGAAAAAHAQAEAQAQPQPQPQAVDKDKEDGGGTASASSEPAVDADALPVNINRIRKALSRAPAIRPENTRAVFRVQVFSRSPTIDDILGPDWRKGPTPLGAMSHQEFLNLVTPTDVQGYAAFDNKQAVTVAATSFALQWAVSKAMKKLDEAMTERQKDAARKEVDEALAALRKARREAGLPDK
jgi:hypothetical protein